MDSGAGKGRHHGHVVRDATPIEPLPDAALPDATTLPEIIEEMLLAKNSERQGRVIDHDEAGSMEQKKREGYF